MAWEAKCCAAMVGTVVGIIKKAAESFFFKSYRTHDFDKTYTGTAFCFQGAFTDNNTVTVAHFFSVAFHASMRSQAETAGRLYEQDRHY